MRRKRTAPFGLKDRRFSEVAGPRHDPGRYGALARADLGHAVATLGQLYGEVN